MESRLVESFSNVFSERLTPTVVQRLAQAFHLLHAPESLNGLEHALTALISLNRFSQFLKVPENESFVMPPSADLFSALKEVQKLDPDSNYRSKKTHGMIKEHGVWCALVSHDMGADDTTLWHHYCVIVFSVILYERIERADLNQLGSGVNSASLVIRKLYGNKNLRSDSFPPFASRIQTADEYYQELLKERDNPDNEHVSSLNLVLTLLNQYRSNKDKIDRAGGTRSDLARSTRNTLSDDPTDRLINTPICHEITFESDHSNSELTRLQHEALNRHEFLTERISQVEFDESGKLGVSDLRARYARQRAQIRSIAKLNQHLPYRYGGLSTLEANTVLQHVLAGLKESSGDDAKTKLFILFTTFLGREIDQLQNLRIYPSRKHLPKSLSDPVVYLIQESSFHLIIDTPVWKKTIDEKQKKLLYESFNGTDCPTDGSILIAAPKLVHSKLEELFGNELDAGKTYVQFCQTRNRSQLIQSVKELIKELDKNKRITLDRLRSFAIDQILSVTQNDYAIAHMLTGQSFTISEVSKHYISLQCSSLEEMLASAIELTLKNAGYEERLTRHVLSVSEDRGSRLNIKTDLVHEFVQHLKLGLSNAKRLPPGFERVREVHNSLVLYISIWILFETGYRSVNDLVFNLNEIDFDTGLVIVSDKDNESSTNTRLSYVSPLLRNQIRTYLSHLERLREIYINDVNIAGPIKNLTRTGSVDTPLLFFLGNARKKLIRVTPSSVKEHFSELIIPLNSNRHFLSSELRRRGALPEYVDIFMGHWQIGQEPHGKYSALSPLLVIDGLKPYLTDIQKDCDWTCLRGLVDA